MVRLAEQRLKGGGAAKGRLAWRHLRRVQQQGGVDAQVWVGEGAVPVAAGVPLGAPGIADNPVLEPSARLQRGGDLRGKAHGFGLDAPAHDGYGVVALDVGGAPRRVQPARLHVGVDAAGLRPPRLVGGGAVSRDHVFKYAVRAHHGAVGVNLCLHGWRVYQRGGAAGHGAKDARLRCVRCGYGGGGRGVG